MAGAGAGAGAAINTPQPTMAPPSKKARVWMNKRNSIHFACRPVAFQLRIFIAYTHEDFLFESMSI